MVVGTVLEDEVVGSVVVVDSVVLNINKKFNNINCYRFNFCVIRNRKFMKRAYQFPRKLNNTHVFVSGLSVVIGGSVVGSSFEVVVDSVTVDTSGS